MPVGFTLNEENVSLLSASPKESALHQGMFRKFRDSACLKRKLEEPMDNMLEKLDALSVRYKEIEEEMNQPDVMQDMKRYIKLSKDYKDLQPVMAAYKDYRNLLSNIASAKEDIAATVRTVFELAGAAVSHSEGYPGWKPNTHSEILAIATASYRRLFDTDAKVKAIHAGLECGLFLDKYPTLDMISFGPTLQGVHSPDERMHIPSVERFWLHLTDILKHIPEKA